MRPAVSLPTVTVLGLHRRLITDGTAYPSRAVHGLLCTAREAGGARGPMAWGALGEYCTRPGVTSRLSCNKAMLPLKGPLVGE